MTPFQAHLQRWGDCRECPLWETRKRIVIARGKVPCDILFIGEAPGESEDVSGLPFVGQAGELLDNPLCIPRAGIIQRALPGKMVNGRYRTDLRLGFANLLCCIPREADGGKAGEPPHDSIMACRSRLEDFIVEVARPCLIVAVGRHSEDYLKQGYKHSVKVPEGIKQIAIKHPAAILRMNLAQQGLEIQRCVVTISNAAEELV